MSVAGPVVLCLIGRSNLATHQREQGLAVLLSGTVHELLLAAESNGTDRRALALNRDQAGIVHAWPPRLDSASKRGNPQPAISSRSSSRCSSRSFSSGGQQACLSGADDLFPCAAFPLRPRSAPPPQPRPALLRQLPPADRVPGLPSPAQVPWVAPNLCRKG